jgi:hypothetical protein
MALFQATNRPESRAFNCRIGVKREEMRPEKVLFPSIQHLITQE